MPIEIRELTIKAVVRDGDAGETTEAGSDRAQNGIGSPR